MIKYLAAGSFCLLLGNFSRAGEVAHSWGMGLNFRSFSYKESLTPPLRSEEKAQFISPLIYHQYQQGDWSLKTQFEGFFDFSSQYTGTTLSGVATEGEDRHSLWDFNFEFAYHLDPDWQIISGMGYHYWDRFLNGESGYREIYTWYFVDLGMEARLWRTSIESMQMTTSARIRYRQMFQGSIHVIFSETYSAGEDSMLALGNKGGYWLEIPWQFRIQESSSLYILTPWYSRSEIGASNLAYNGTPLRSGTLGLIREPASLTEEMGIKFTLERSW